ncbi:hypothetical protein [Saccharothrix longispora]|uniref:hypothetical protein n=1 Tax=Saccharothrix longispora TaxID=33920 RepID=UPI0028FDC22F|nr:hypothetical protein [Saccharothrix longispora]MDU0287676.1 hypothetical protein [Saccharothrix longispora]
MCAADTPPTSCGHPLLSDAVTGTVRVVLSRDARCNVREPYARTEPTGDRPGVAELSGSGAG